MMKIACWGYYGKQNLGDDLILAELLKYLQEFAPDAEVTVFSNTKKAHVSTGGHICFCQRSAKELIRASLTQDVLICGPGGLMPQRSTRKLLLWVFLALIMKVRRRSLLFLGLGIGCQNFQHRTDRLLLRLLVILSRAFVVRQNGVNAALKTDRAREAADVVFAVQPVHRLEKEPKSIVFSLAHVFGNTADDECRKFVDGMVRIIDDLMAEGYTIHFVEFTKGNDMYLYQRILEQLHAPENVKIHPYSDNPYAMIDVFQKAELCICMRFHSLVLAAITNTPCCIISYSDKMDDVANRLDLMDYAVQICPISTLYYGRLISFNEQQFSGVLRQLIKNQSAVKKQLMNKVCVLQEKARINWDALSNVIDLHRKSK